MENIKIKLVVPVITSTSTLTELTLKLLYSFQESDRLEVENILANREKFLINEREAIEKSLKSEIHKLRRDRDMLVIERDAIEKSLKFELGKSHENYEIMVKRERELMEKKVDLVVLEKLKVEDEFGKCRRELEEKVEILEKEVNELRKGNGGVEIGVFSSDPSSIYSSARSGNSDSNKRVRNEEFGPRKMHSEICQDKYEVLGSVQLPKHFPEVGSECLEERTIGVQSGEFGRRKETQWKTPADLFSSFRSDPELCMSAVCALYRRHISAGKSTADIGFRSFDIASGTEAAKYLINNDLSNKLSRSLSEVQLDRPSTLETCWRLSIKYLKQLFDMYQKKSDPFFCPES